jgi:putative alpha-1,2-mannosidase
MLAPYLWDYLPGKCHKTQYWSRAAVAMHFHDSPAGLPGNDDYGSMSTWLLWGSLGVYPVAGTDIFLVGSPAVQAATVTLQVPTHYYTTTTPHRMRPPLLTLTLTRTHPPCHYRHHHHVIIYVSKALDGTTSELRITSSGNSVDAVYVALLTVNGEHWRNTSIPRSVLAAPGGCTLHFTMSTLPRSSLCTEM